MKPAMGGKGGQPVAGIDSVTLIRSGSGARRLHPGPVAARTAKSNALDGRRFMAGAGAATGACRENSDR